MSTYYFDTSALVKLYVPEVGSEWVDLLIGARDSEVHPRHVVAISEIGVVEVSAALARRERDGGISTSDRSIVRKRFERDCYERFFLLAVRRDVILRASDLAPRRALRAYDALHLATALVLSDTLGLASMALPTFVSADGALNVAAAEEGLEVVEPR